MLLVGALCEGSVYHQLEYDFSEEQPAGSIVATTTPATAGRIAAAACRITLTHAGYFLYFTFKCRQI